MRLLAFETSTGACSVALWLDGAVTEAFEVAPQRHAELALAMADRLLGEAGLVPGDLDAIAFARGPGSFTGVRIAAGLAQGAAFAAGLPVVPVSTLRALAQGTARVRGEGAVLAALDARMGEVYWGAFRLGAAGLMEPAAQERLCVPEAATCPEGAGPGWFGAGSGWAEHGERLRRTLSARIRAWDADCLPHARDVAALAAADYRAGRAVSAQGAIPVYLRERVVSV